MPHRLDAMRHGYQGSYRIELREEYTVLTGRAPKVQGVTIKGNVIEVQTGKVRSFPIGCQCHALDELFQFNWKQVDRILDAEGGVLWQNRDYGK
jgi:hypothetical protein